MKEAMVHECAESLFCFPMLFFWAFSIKYKFSNNALARSVRADVTPSDASQKAFGRDGPVSAPLHR